MIRSLADFTILGLTLALLPLAAGAVLLELRLEERSDRRTRRRA